MIELALEWALKAHKGQKDKGGEPYITHPLRLMTGMPDDTTRAVVGRNRDISFRNSLPAIISGSRFCIERAFSM